MDRDGAPVLTVTGLRHRYADRTVFEDVSFTLPVGTTGLVGVNGAGKTTLLNILATTLRSTAGEIRLSSSSGRRRGGDLLELRRRVALVPQIFVPPRSMRVDQFLTYMAWMRGVRRPERAESVARALEAVELSSRGRDRFASLSGGMVQRANLAQALLAKPELVLLDEPMSGLDPEQRVRLRQLIERIGLTSAVLISSHVMDDIVPIAARILMLDRGRLAFDDSPEALAEIGAGLVQAGSGLSPYETAFLALRAREESRC